MINLLPASEKNEIRKEYRLRALTTFFAMLFAALLVTVFSFLPTYFFALSRHEAFLSESQSDAMREQVSRAKDMETTVLETNKKIDALKSGASAPRVKDIFLEILESKSGGIAITGLSYDFSSGSGKGATNVGTVGITGRSSDRATLLAFKDALAQKKEFGAVDLPISNLVKDTNLDFSINLVVAQGKLK